MVECPSQGALLVTNAHIQEVYVLSRKDMSLCQTCTREHCWSLTLIFRRFMVECPFQGALLVTNAHIQEVYGRMSFLGSTVGH